MKKLFAAAILAMFASVAFASSDLSLALYNPPQKVENHYTAVASQAPAPAVVQDMPAPELATNIQQGAAKLGSFLGNVMKGAVNTGKAFTNGISNGMSGKSSSKSASTGASQSVGADVASQQAVQAATATAATPVTTATPAMNFGPLKVAIAMIERAKAEAAAAKAAAAAPVEERSVVASSTNY